MATKQELQTTFILDANGNVAEKLEEMVTVEEKTQEELIAEKEAELLKMYQELEALKSQNS